MPLEATRWQESDQSMEPAHVLVNGDVAIRENGILGKKHLMSAFKEDGIVGKEKNGKLTLMENIALPTEDADSEKTAVTKLGKGDGDNHVMVNGPKDGALTVNRLNSVVKSSDLALKDDIINPLKNLIKTAVRKVELVKESDSESNSGKTSPVTVENEQMWGARSETHGQEKGSGKSFLSLISGGF